MSGHVLGLLDDAVKKINHCTEPKVGGQGKYSGSSHMSFVTWISQVLKKGDGKQLWMCCHKLDYLKATFCTGFLHVFPNIKKQGINI